MANYAYIYHEGLTENNVSKVLREAVSKVLEGRLVVTKADFEDLGPTWLVTAPDTALTAYEANQALMPPEQDFGFIVSLMRGRPGGLSFRRPLNYWESWVQSCVVEELSEALGSPHTYDATDVVHEPGTREYRKFKTFQQWLYRNFDDPPKHEDGLWVEGRFKDSTPKGFW